MLRDLSKLTGTMGVCGTHLVGVPASELPVGFPLTGLLNNDVDPADPAGCLYRVEVLERPSQGAFTIEENGAFSLLGAPDGVYTGPLNNYKNDVLWDGTYNFTIGAAGTVVTVTGVTVTPSTSTLTGGATLQLSATVVGTNSPAQTVTWTTIGGGSVSSTGMFTAPLSTTSTQTVTVRATSTVDPTKFGSSTITIPAVAVPVVPTVNLVSVAPLSPIVEGAATQQFTAAVIGTNSPPQGVTWTAIGGGSITSTGMFTAPLAAIATQYITVTATSTFDPTKSGSATVTVPATGAGELPGDFTASPSRTVKVDPDSITRPFIAGSAWNLSSPKKPRTNKDPQAVLDYTFDWTDWLTDSGDEIDPYGLSFTFDNGAVAEGVFLTGGTRVTVMVSGGTPLTRVSVTCRITTRSVPPRVDERTVYLDIEDA